MVVAWYFVGSLACGCVAPVVPSPSRPWIDLFMLMYFCYSSTNPSASAEGSSTTSNQIEYSLVDTLSVHINDTGRDTDGDDAITMCVAIHMRCQTLHLISVANAAPTVSVCGLCVRAT